MTNQSKPKEYESMAIRIIAIERSGTATPDFADWESITVRDEGTSTRPVYGHIQVFGIADDGTRHSLFGYYSDEAAYAPGELGSLLIGATPEDARRRASDLRARRDVVFLRSQ
jgi:hypothetical protein